MILIALFSLIIVLLYKCIHRKLYPSNFPPGPRNALIFVGDPLIEIGPYGGIDELMGQHKKYGPIVGFNFFGQKIVSISDLEILAKVLCTDDFTSRAHFEGLTVVRQFNKESGSCPGILSNNGENWKNNRRFTIMALRNLGYGKKALEEIIVEESHALVEKINETNGQPLETKDLFNVPVLNAVWKILVGETVDQKNTDLIQAISFVEHCLANLNSTVGFLALSSKHLLFILEKLNILSLTKKWWKIYDVIDVSIEKHISNYDNEGIRDFIDVFIQSRIKRENTSDYEKRLAYHDLRNIILDLLFGGSETTSNTLRWAILFMVLNPEKQAKVQEELDQVYGEVDFISNRSSTPYTEAVIHESQRLGNLFPVAIPHFTSNTAVVGDFIIPKGTHIVPFLAGIMLDDKTFPEPRRFAPERYIDEGNRFKAHPSVIPFGIGKRRCLGENLARTEIFYFFTSILKNFDIRLPEGAKNPSTEYKPGITLSPYPFQVRFVRRSKAK